VRTRSRSWVACGGACLLGVVSLATMAQTAAPPEVARTTTSFAGHWVLDGTSTDPGQAPAHVQGTIDCSPAALGAAVNCSIAVQIEGFGPVEAAAVIGFSPDEKVVRWMEISSTGEYHDHRGPWKGDSIDFVPLSYVAGGENATEYLRVGFPSAGQMVLKATTKTAGGDSVLECRGKRQ
jgi:hypothetical protein